MKLTNYKYGYINAFDCSIHGKIVATQKEWQDCLRYLLRLKPDTSYPFYKYMIKEDAKRQIKTKQGYIVNIRVWATGKIAKRYNLQGYKRANYMFLILNA